ncbi:MAG: TetR/AcrR family transcriptional regulator [Alphaproteobacteria bacterium]|nr:TetR/AcrR family transcriptional regulator [Alphaproteobacteria bacterium]
MANGVKRVRRTPDEARRLILDAAREAIARTGPDGLRLHDIAAAAGVSHPLILHHFGSRAGLVRALTREAIAELRDKLITAMAEPHHSTEELLGRVFEAFRDGLGQRLAWLATIDPDGDQGGSTMIQREFAEHLHARRVAAAPAGTTITQEESQFLVHLIAIAALGEAIYGTQFRRSAGLSKGPETDRRFWAWLAALIRARTTPA